MSWLMSHLRNKFLAGALAAIPIGIVLYGVFWIESQTRTITTSLGIHYPGIGIVVAIVGVYLIGVLVTSLVGQAILGVLNKVLLKVPGLNMLYRAWKDILVTPPNKTSTFHEAVLIPTDPGQWQLGFTSGEALPGNPENICVLVPHIPSPFSGRLVIVRRDACMFLKMSVEDAIKFHLSTGNYLPPGLGTKEPKP